LSQHFHPAIGRPTEELYSIAGLLFVMEFRDWNHEEAADAYMFNVDSRLCSFPQVVGPKRSKTSCIGHDVQWAALAMSCGKQSGYRV
jgi:hypothetical protein